MNEFIDVTRINGGKSITINTNSIIYFRPSKLSKSNRTEIMINGIEKPFIVEECYEDVKSKIYNKDSSLEYDEYNGNESKDNEKETKDDKELNIIDILSDKYYNTTVGEYLENNNTFVDYKNLNLDNYVIAYKNLLLPSSRVVCIYNDEDEESTGYIKIGKFKFDKSNSNIFMYMIDNHHNMYNMICYDNYIGHDIISVYLNDLINNDSDIDYPINKQYRLNVQIFDNDHNL